MKFKSFYSKTRFRYIHKLLEASNDFDFSGNELIPKTGYFASEDVDVYIDTSDGVNDDLSIQEYCGRMLACIRMSKGKKFLFFKASYSPMWSQSLSRLAEENNGKVIPFFKWSFNDSFYDHTMPNIKNLRSSERDARYDVGIFADLTKLYTYPKPSSSNSIISNSDHRKFILPGHSANTGEYEINSRPSILNKIKDSGLNYCCDSFSYEKYMETSMRCSTILNPPGIGEYTSRMMDQSVVGNLLILRKNSYDHGNSWKDYIPEVDFAKENWLDDYRNIMNDAVLWREKILYYYEELWSPNAVYSYFTDHIKKELQA
jgi:hypothetical protein